MVFQQNSQEQVSCRAIREGRHCGSRVFFKTRSEDTVVRLK
jgi:DNA-directed RNA polymerase subunit RPC12/RpoP